MHKRNKILVLVSLLASSLLFACTQAKDSVNSITIATAANMHYTMQALSKAFTEETGIECQLVVSSSGKLTAQINEGAPFDVFVSADMKYPNDVYNSGQAESPPVVYAYGQLVLWTAIEGAQASIDSLNSQSIEHIALANPKTAPYGKAAMEVLEYYQLEDTIQSKLVYGESISQTNQFILSNAADIGFTALAVVMSPEMKGKGHWVALDPSIYSPIEQGVVVLNGERTNIENAQLFYDFLFSDEAKMILKDFGYSIDE